MGLRYTEEIRTQEGYVRGPVRSTVRTYYGPCLLCGRETRFGDKWILRYGEPWVEKQFKRRTNLLKVLLGGRPVSPSPETIETLVCLMCRQKCKAIREEAVQRRIAEDSAKQKAIEDQQESCRRRRERLEADREFHYTWRMAKVREFDRTKHSARFQCTLADGSSFKVIFRWRATSGQCRGDSPQNIVGMWVDGQLIAHYSAWILEPFPADVQNDFVDCEPRADLFGYGFCRWFRLAFQQRLRRIQPSAIWDAGLLKRPGDLDMNSLKSPTVVHTQWCDGSIHATLFYDPEDIDVARIADFARNYLDLKVEERALEPSAHTVMAGPVDS